MSLCICRNIFQRIYIWGDTIKVTQSDSWIIIGVEYKISIVKLKNATRDHLAFDLVCTLETTKYAFANVVLL